MPKREYLNPSALPQPPGNFSWLTRSGNTVWISGMVGIDRQGAMVGLGDAEAQTKQIYANVEAALRELGGGLNNLVKTVTYVVGRDHIPGMSKVREALRREGRITNLPASTLLLVAGLASPDYLVEMDSVAILD